MSEEMLRQTVHPPISRLGLELGESLIPLQFDFSIPRNVIALRDELTAIFEDEPILFSLLGNTAANFEQDSALVELLSKQLLGPNDRLLLEVAKTAHVDKALASRAAREYNESDLFGIFITSALRHNTDINVNMDWVSYVGSVVDESVIQIKVLYRNEGGEIHRITLPLSETVPFPDGDTIRLDLTRKYSEAGLERLLSRSGSVQLHKQSWQYDSQRDGFGVDLVLLAPEGGRAAQQEDTVVKESRVEAIWGKQVT